MVKMIDGTKFVDTFVDRTAVQIVLKDHGRVKREFIKKIAPYVDLGFVWVTPHRPEEFDREQAKAFPQLCPLRKWENTDPAYSNNGHLSSYQNGHWVSCQRTLDEHGNCPEHGQVRFNPHQAAKEAKERQAKEPARLRKEPPRRKPNGKTTARMMHVRKVNNW